jgi:hypothetical protein
VRLWNFPQADVFRVGFLSAPTPSMSKMTDDRKEEIFSLKKYNIMMKEVWSSKIGKYT